MAFRFPTTWNCNHDSSLVNTGCLCSFVLLLLDQSSWGELNNNKYNIIHCRICKLELLRICSSQVLFPYGGQTILYIKQILLRIALPGTWNPSRFSKWSLQNRFPTYFGIPSLVFDFRKDLQTDSSTMDSLHVCDWSHMWLRSIRFNSLLTSQTWSKKCEQLCYTNEKRSYVTSL